MGKILKRIKRFFKDIWYIVLLVVSIVIMYMLDFIGTLLDFAPFFFISAIPILMLSVFWTPIFYIYMTIFLLFIGIKTIYKTKEDNF